MTKRTPPLPRRATSYSSSPPCHLGDFADRRSLVRGSPLALVPVPRSRTVTDTLAADTALPQQRRLITEVPGPRSRALLERRAGSASAGVGTTLPVFVERAGGGVVVDVDGNSLIDLGSGIAVVNVGNAAPRVVAAVQEQVAAFTHTCFMVTPYESYVAVCEELARLV